MTHNHIGEIQQMKEDISELLGMNYALYISEGCRDSICYLLGYLSDVEAILVIVANNRTNKELTGYTEGFEESLFDEWLLLYEICKHAITKGKLSHEDVVSVKDSMMKADGYLMHLMDESN